MKNQNQEWIKNRPRWFDMFFGDTLYWSYKSHDAQTQCGCVLVRDNTIVTQGYNGFMRNINDYALPNLRDDGSGELDKYPFMIHAEHNAIINCARLGQSTVGLDCFVTGKPCISCLQLLYQAGIANVFYSNFNSPKMMANDNHEQIWNMLIKLMDSMNVYFIDSKTLNLQHIKDMGNRI